MANGAYTGCSMESGFSKTADGSNHLSGLSYDASGNTLNDGVNPYVWNAESELKTGNGTNYLYDGDGRRVSKVGNMLYWYGAGDQILAETNTSGTVTAEYVFFGGKRVAMLPAGGNATYYVEDLLGTSRVMTTNTGVVCYDADFYPYGGERSYTNACPQNYKFEGKERDTETGNDDFDARYYSNRFGRWLSADWSAVPAPVPYANFTNPQTLNLYGMVADDPESFADLDGHCCDVEDVLDAVDFVAGFINTAASNNGLAIRQDARGDQTFANGQTAGDVVTTIQGGLEVLAGAGGEVGGVTLDATGVGAVLGVPANIVSAGVIAHGGAVAVNSAGHLVQDAMNAPVEKRQGDFKPSEREQAIKDNAQASGGTNKCEKCGQEVVRTQNKPGQTPPKNQLHVHHDPAIRHGGGRHSKKRIFCRECHQEEHKQ